MTDKQYNMIEDEDNKQEEVPEEVPENSSVKWKRVFGILIVLGIAFSWVGATQFAQSTYSPNFNAPYFTTWFSTCWMIVVFPLYCIPSLIRWRTFVPVYRESVTVLGRQGLTLKSLATVVLPFAILWMLTNYLYIRALGIIQATDVTAVFSCCNAFVYIFSWIWLKEKISIIRVSAVILSIGGIVMMSYAEGFGDTNALGTGLSVASAIGAALYKVLFKKVVGDATASQVSIFLTFLGLLDLTLLWPIIVIFKFTYYELIDWSDMPWLFLCGTGFLGLIFNFLVNFGIAFTYPLFISLGVVLGIPVNAVADAVIRGKDFGTFKIIAAILIILGFVFMLVPDKYENKLRRKMCCKSSAGDDDDSIIISE